MRRRGQLVRWFVGVLLGLSGWVLACGLNEPVKMDPHKPCIECHQKDLQGVKEPSHATMDEDCKKCHATDKWKPASLFKHEAFKRKEAHAKLDCKECHTDGKYKGTATTCYGCHDDDYKKTSYPDHKGGKYSQECERCHNEVAWKWKDHDHDLYYKLRGAHKDLSCEKCHEKAPALGLKGFKGLDDECRSCHEDDYKGTKAPNHDLTGIGKKCEDCHNDEKWKPAPLFNHERYFPIKRHIGHKNRKCEECHTSKDGDYKQFDCLSCHSYQDMVVAHRTTGWTYNSKECYRCHPRGI